MKLAKRRVGLLLTLVLAVQASGCGLLLYPERKGQQKGDLDPAIVVLDAVGLLFFILPGVVAFIVDFHHGTIYLPEKKIVSDAAPPPATGPIRYFALRAPPRASGESASGR